MSASGAEGMGFKPWADQISHTCQRLATTENLTCNFWHKPRRWAFERCSLSWH